MRIVVEVVINSQGEIDHFLGLGNNLGLAAESCEEMAGIAVVLLDRKEPALWAFSPRTPACALRYAHISEALPPYVALFSRKAERLQCLESSWRGHSDIRAGIF
jgi:hypothetical protein